MILELVVMLIVMLEFNPKLSEDSFISTEDSLVVSSEDSLELESSEYTEKIFGSSEVVRAFSLWSLWVGGLNLIGFWLIPIRDCLSSFSGCSSSVFSGSSAIPGFRSFSPVLVPCSVLLSLSVFSFLEEACRFLR